MAPLHCMCRRGFLSAILGRSGRAFYRPISTSGKKKDESATCPPPESIYKKVPDFSKPLENKNWVSYGFDEKDRHEDTYRYHVLMFCFMTIIFCGSSFVYMYAPDRGRRNWAHREAFIRLHEREQLGLEPIDPNYVDPETIELPPDEEIGPDEIII